MAIANFAKLQLADPSFFGYLVAIGQSLTRFLIHGLPEILAFITAGLAGGIISVAVIRHHLFTKKAHTIILDSSILILVSVIILVIATLLEVFVTPTFMSLF